ncbi:unnamed protein product [Amoebophrya sp. A120]|nr:unnamed protein product [Amoebophrya sp. A120]|eukprot:GSA120T00012418001.1
MATSSSSTHLQPHHGSAHNSHATSSSMSTNTDEKFQRLLRRMEHCAKAREASTRVLSLRFAERDVVRSSLQRESMAAKDAYHEADKQRSERCIAKQKLQKSPYLNDLSAEYEMLTEEQKIRDRIEKKKQYLMKKRQQDAETAVIQRMLNDKDELEDLRKDYQSREILGEVNKAVIPGSLVKQVARPLVAKSNLLGIIHPPLVKQAVTRVHWISHRHAGASMIRLCFFRAEGRQAQESSKGALLFFLSMVMELGIDVGSVLGQEAVVRLS